MGTFGASWSAGGNMAGRLGRLSAFFVLYTLTWHGLFQFAGVFEVAPHASIWFPPAGLRLAFLLIFGWRFGLVVFCAEAVNAFFTGILDAWGISGATGVDLPKLISLTLAIALPPACYALAAFALQRGGWPAGGADPFTGILYFLFIVGLAAAANGILSCLNLALIGLLPWSEFRAGAGGRATGDLIGILTLTPFILLATRWIPRAGRTAIGRTGGIATPWHGAPAAGDTTVTRAVLEGGAISLFAGMALIAGSNHLHPSGVVHWYPFLLPVIWLALRFGLPAAIIGTFTMNLAAASIAAAVGNVAAFQDVQVFMVTLSMTGLLMGTVVSELRHEKASLDLRVRSRTFDLLDEIERRQRAEQAALQEKQRTESYLAIAQPAIVATDRDARITLVNNSAMRLLGCQSAELLGRDWSEVLGAEAEQAKLRSLHRTFIDRAFSEGEPAETPNFKTQVRGPDGGIRIIDWRSALIRGSDGSVHGILCSGDDITERVAAEEKLRYLASHDLVTGLNNRNWLLDHFPQATARARRQGNLLAVLFIDLTGFKQINDGFGHACGDATLAETALRLKECVRASDLVTRLGGDEFVVLLEDAGEPQAVARVAEKILQTLAQPLPLEHGIVMVGASIGIALFPDDGETAEELLSKADAAMYLAKRDQAHGYCFASGEGFAAAATVAIIGAMTRPPPGRMAE